MKTLVLVFSLCFLPFLSLNSAQAASAGDVLINEIAWMGTTNSANDEWIELRNNTDLLIDLNGWVLKTADGTPSIKLTGSDPANGFYLLERTDDNTVPQITADQTYTGTLNNEGEKLELFDSQDNLVDSADYLSGWLTGDNATKQTMERKNANAWQTSQNPGGTPKAENSNGETSVKPSLTETKPNPVGEGTKKEIAAISEPIKQTQDKQIRESFSPLLIALTIAIFSGIIIFFLKKRVQDIDLL